ncbi:SusC/RagA family TonB-linked outer membrane protein [Flavobacterium sp. NST-5]|uniref:SusC/RagA family TonB-linked outer membrane protein n=1 Tax=Flavobacterium ichthyis TaxID=2698827 RepID=A0ABW9ZBU3_9FLAO|nr:TonB-dependent receptor [Flavobacterium ichthyis]NBL64243.1 SusC/RagA family TonB-linked outer membrane protein [Flavobacterium ichthyis]
MKNFIFGVFAFLLFHGAMVAQEITGKVQDQDGLPLPGVTITAPNSSAVSDFDGNFSINAEVGQQLTFSFLGYNSVSLPAASGMTISMSSSATDLSEVVVIGYGTAKRSELTGSVSTIKSGEITKQPAFNALQSLQGKAAGVNIIANDAPGATPTIIIRGLGTAEGGRTPIFVVDGVITGSIANLAPSDIESFDIVKDAATAAIYGSNAANGVVLITTKRGRTGKTRVNVDSFYGARSTVNAVKMANADQYITYFNDFQRFSPQTANTYFLQENQPYDTDWYDELTDIGMINSNNISFSGGGESSTYFFSFNNFNEDGILKNQDITRNTLRSNTSFKALNDRLKITNNVNLTFTKSTPKPFGAFSDAYRQSPLTPVYYPTGQWGQNFVNATTGVIGYLPTNPGDRIGRLNTAANPVASVHFANERNKMTELQGSIEAEYKITDWLKITSRFGATKSFSKRRVYSDLMGTWLAGDPTRTQAEYEANHDAMEDNVTTWSYNSLSYADVESYRYNWDNFLTFEHSFGKHNFDAVLGATQDRRNDVYTSTIRGFDVPTQSNYWNINFAEGVKIAEQQFSTPTQILSYFGRLQYNFDERYFISGVIRRDGNSDFRNNRNYWGTFPSVSAGWVISNESFMAESKTFDFLKLRAGYGEVGNSNIPRNQSSVITNPGSNSVNYVFGPNQDFIYGAAYGTPATDLMWEVTKEINAGIDFAILDNKLSGNIDYYNRLNTNSILKIKPIMNSPNMQDFFDHGGEVRNEGFEVGLNWRDQINDDFSYSIGGNYSRNTNTLESVKPAYDGYIGGSLGNGQITKQLREGQPIYSWWMFETEGVWQNQAEIDSNPRIGNPQPGQLRYKDQNGDGLIDDRDKKFFGSYIPKFTYALSVNVNYKNFDFSVDGIGVGGNKVYNGLKGTRIDGGENIAAETFNNRWTGEGSTNSNPGANRDALASNYYLEDGDYFRINNITLGYTFKELPGISKLRVYGTAQNPFMFTKYSGFTPELNQNGNPGETAGIELSAYPTLKTFIFGINLEL